MNVIKAVSTKVMPDVIVRSGDEVVVYLSTPKVASTAMKSYLKAAGGKAIGRSGAMRHKNRIQLIRHPAIRLQSAYHFGWARKTRDWDDGAVAADFRDWWTQVREDVNFDVHTAPQTCDGEVDGTVLYRLEEIRLWWPILARRYPFMFGFGPLLRANVSSREPISISDDLMLDIEEIYAHDLSAWRRASLIHDYSVHSSASDTSSRSHPRAPIL